MRNKNITIIFSIGCVLCLFGTPSYSFQITESVLVEELLSVTSPHRMYIAEKNSDMFIEMTRGLEAKYLIQEIRVFLKDPKSNPRMGRLEDPSWSGKHNNPNLFRIYEIGKFVYIDIVDGKSFPTRGTLVRFVFERGKSSLSKMVN